MRLLTELGIDRFAKYRAPKPVTLPPVSLPSSASHMVARNHVRFGRVKTNRERETCVEAKTPL